MKIISKFKDYYDHLQGIYGIDPLKVLDRTQMSVNTYHTSDRGFTLYFCGSLYEHQCDSLTHHKNYAEALLRFTKSKYLTPKGHIVYQNETCFWAKLDRRIDAKLNFPYGVLLPVDFRKPETATIKSVLILKNLGFYKVMSAEECYRQIEQFIGKSEMESNTDVTDMDRFEAKGFSKKESFRG